jgi:hypothetical protein
MSNSNVAKLINVLSITVAVVILLLPFHAFLTVWLASLFGHYTLLRLWKEVVLLVVGLVVLGLLFRDHAMRRALYKNRLFWLIGIYTLLLLFLGFTSFTHHQVSGKALAYGLLEDLRYLLFFGLCLGIAARNNWLQKHGMQVLLIPALVVVLFGLLQAFVLPYNFLQHFGYSSTTIAPFETVNSNLHYVRVQSTLRGANPLGAYLVLVIVVIVVQFMRSHTRRDKLEYGLFGVAAAIVLFFTYSRSAWIGAGLSVACLVVAAIKSKRIRQWTMLSVAVLVVVGAGGALVLRHNSRFENIVFHTSPNTIPTTSDQNHVSALRQGLHDLTYDPLGRGPGTAGPASVYNLDGPVRIAENYFIQIGQETGWLGLALFLLINVVVMGAMWRVRSEPMALALWASLIGISFIGLFSHVWSDDTLSYIWWGLAGVALSPYLLSKVTKTND